LIFSELPEDFDSKEWKPPQEPPCIIKHLCEKHEGLEIEAKVIKEGNSENIKIHMDVTVSSFYSTD
jgi:hypothetical protein